MRWKIHRTTGAIGTIKFRQSLVGFNVKVRTATSDKEKVRGTYESGNVKNNDTIFAI